MQPLRVVISTFLLLDLLPSPGAGEFCVVAPRAPVIALIGEKAVLPCHLKPETNADGMKVTWERIDNSGLVHLYDNSRDQLKKQRPEYRGRTEFLKKDIHLGQVALKIQPIMLSDDGQYRCFFESSSFYDDAKLTLSVAALGMDPQIHFDTGGDSGEVKLICTSTGWYPEPEVQWRDLQGRSLTPDSETKRKAENGMFRVETSLKVTVKSLNVSCAIRNPVLSEEKESYASVSGESPPESESSEIPAEQGGDSIRDLGVKDLEGGLLIH